MTSLGSLTTTAKSPVWTITRVRAREPVSYPDSKTAFLCACEKGVCDFHWEASAKEAVGAVQYLQKLIRQRHMFTWSKPISSNHLQCKPAVWLAQIPCAFSVTLAGDWSQPQASPTLLHTSFSGHFEQSMSARKHLHISISEWRHHWWQFKTLERQAKRCCTGSFERFVPNAPHLVR